MDFAFTQEEEQFREQLRRFLAEHLPADWSTRSFLLGGDSDERDELARQMNALLAERKWLAIAWPQEHGGLDAGYMQQLIFNEETAYRAMPGGGGVGVSSVGPSLMLYGSTEQQRQHLPRIANAEDTYCLLYSEPGAGSDLAAVQTEAVRDGDVYVINGQKVWAAGAQRANMGWLAARTDPGAPKHQGISTFIVPMDTPGISVRPLANMAGEHTLNEVYLENVRVPVENLIGVENRGWYQIATGLDFERSGVQSYAHGKRNVETLVQLAKEEPALVRNSPNIRYELADRWLELEVGFSIAHRIPWMQQQGIVPNAEASMSKLYGSELTQRIAGTGVRLLGLAGQLAPGSENAVLGGALARSYLTAVASTIAGGTSEIQRNIIAQRGLGMPRSS